MFTAFAKHVLRPKITFLLLSFITQIANFTYGVIPESQLLDDALTFTAAVKMYSSANIKVQGLLLSLAALRVITNRVNKNDQENGITLSNVQVIVYFSKHCKSEVG